MSVLEGRHGPKPARSRSRARPLLVALMLAATSALALAVVKPQASPRRTIAHRARSSVVAAHVGHRAPEFVIPTTAGAFDLDAQRHPVAIEVFATWCPECQQGAHDFESLYHRYRERVTFLAIPGSDTGMDGTTPATQADILDFRRAYDVDYPLASYDPRLRAARSYLGTSVPTVTVIDSKKIVTWMQAGAIDADALRHQLATVR